VAECLFAGKAGTPREWRSRYSLNWSFENLRNNPDY